MLIRWIFFDVGDVLLDEDTPHLYFFHSLLLAMRRNGVEVTWDAYYASIRDCVRKKPESAYADAARLYVPDETLWKKIYQEGRAEYQEARKPRPYGLLLDGIEEVVATLEPDFSLGIIANQHPQVLKGLDDYGIGRRFKLRIIDEIVGVAKPDPAIFQLAFKEAGCTPQEALMIGDRPDNDIVPARALGMPTIRFQRGLYYSLYEPLTEAEIPDRVVKKVEDLVPTVRQLAQERA